MGTNAVLRRNDPWGHTIGVVRAIDATHDDQTNGADTLTVRCYGRLDKYDMILWQDVAGAWHEHMVDSVRETHDSGSNPVCEATCINSINLLYDVPVIDVLSENKSVSETFTALFLGCGVGGEGNTWYKYGGDSMASDDVRAKRRTLRFFHTSVREAIQQICEAFECEIYTWLTVGDGEITQRWVGVTTQGGRQTVIRRFEFGRNVPSVTRVVDTRSVKTAVVGYGKVLDIPDTISEADRAVLEKLHEDGYGPRVDFSDVNNGLIYYVDPDGYQRFGEIYCFYTDDDQESPAQLLADAQAYLEPLTTPLVTYTASIAELTLSQDAPWLEVKAGDIVDVVDTAFTPALRVRGRVTRVVRKVVGTGATEGTVTITNNADPNINYAQRNALIRQAKDLQHFEGTTKKVIDSYKTQGYASRDSIRAGEWKAEIDGTRVRGGTVNYITTTSSS